MSSRLEAVRVVLVEPKSPGNVGSVARVCANAGLGEIRVVGPIPWKDGASYWEEAHRMARHAGPRLEGLVVYESLAQAVADSAFVVGSTARTTGAQRFATPGEAVDEIRARLDDGTVSLIFGREDRGLSQEELQSCDLKVTIPSSDDYSSWNLSHAVAILGARLREVEESLPTATRRFDDEDLAPATHEELERLYEKLQSLLLEAGYLDPVNPDRMMAELRRILGSRGLERRDARVLMGVVHQLAWAVRNHEQR